MLSPLDTSPRLTIHLNPQYSMTLILVGTGGTGSALATHLARMVWTACEKTGQTPHLIFIDPDKVEAKNIGRQQFCPAEIGEYKAMTLMYRLNAAFGLRIQAITQAFTTDLWKELITSLSDIPVAHRHTAPASQSVLLIGAVDNHLARQAMAQVVAWRQGAVWWLDLGNAHDSGRIYIGNQARVEDVERIPESGIQIDGTCAIFDWPAPHLQDPALLEPDATDPGPALSCAELVAREEQSLLVNQAMASFAAQYVYDFVIRRHLTMYRTAFTLDPPTAVSRSLSVDALQLLKAQIQAQSKTPLALEINTHGS